MFLRSTMACHSSAVLILPQATSAVVAHRVDRPAAARLVHHGQLAIKHTGIGAFPICLRHRLGGAHRSLTLGFAQHIAHSAAGLDQRGDDLPVLPLDLIDLTPQVGDVGL